MTILTVQFDRGDKKKYKELLDVFRASVEKHMPDVHFVELVLEPPKRDNDLGWNLTANTFKLAKWVEFVDNTDDDIILADCDMLMLKPCYHAFDLDFDIAYTERLPGTNKPMNGGIMFVKNTKAAKEYMHLLKEINDMMYYKDNFLMRTWQAKYPGMNQTAFMYILENNLYRCKLHAYSTRMWNACDNDWAHVSASTVFLHVKGMLRDAVLSRKQPFGFMKTAMNIWYEAAGEPERIAHVTNPYKPMHRYSRIRAIMAKRKKREAA